VSRSFQQRNQDFWPCKDTQETRSYPIHSRWACRVPCNDPEAVGFSFVAGVNPLVGLWTTVFLGLFPATLGGRPGICSSASGACSVVVAALCASHGPSYLSACAILAGLLQILGGSLQLGQFVRLVPSSVMVSPLQWLVDELC
jgi:MFS superfamily sulfate permease-like transporter